MKEEFIVLAIIAVAIIAICLAVKHFVGPQMAARLALSCIMEAEERLFITTNVGEEKLRLAVAFLYDKLPSIVQTLYPEAEVIKIVQNTFDKYGKSMTEKLKLAAEWPEEPMVSDK